MHSNDGTANAARPTTRLRQLINRTDRVLSVLHPPNAACARIMEKAGCEVGFVGTGGVVGAYTGLSDVGALTMLECVTVAGWIALPACQLCRSRKPLLVIVRPLT